MVIVGLNVLSILLIIQDLHVINDFNIDINYLPLFKRRIRDQFIQEWNTGINNCSKLDYYSKFKKTFCYEEYLDILNTDTLRKTLTCFRLSAHTLEIETGRYNGIDRSNRFCKLCNQHLVETEYHFLLCCTKYTDIRNKYLGHQSWPTLNKFNNIIASNKKALLYKTTKFLKEAFDIRKNALNDLIIV